MVFGLHFKLNSLLVLTIENITRVLWRIKKLKLKLVTIRHIKEIKTKVLETDWYDPLQANTCFDNKKLAKL